MKKYLAETAHYFNKALEEGGDDKIQKIKKIIRHMSYRLIEMNKTWIDECFSTNDYEKWADLIYQLNRHKLMPSCSGGYDHSMETLCLIRAFACNDLVVVEQNLPRELGLCANGYPAYVAFCNLFMALWYKDEKFLQAALPKAIKITQSKKPINDRKMVEFLLAIYENDSVKASECLNEICKTIARTDTDKINRLLIPHGLYGVALRFGLTDLDLPKSNNFDLKFAAWQRANSDYKPKLYFNYPDELEILNIILNHTPAKSVITRPYENDKTYYLDEDTMALNMAKEILKSIDG